MSKKAKNGKGEQGTLPGIKKKKLSKIEAQAEKVRELTNQRLDIQSEEREARQLLISMINAAEKKGELEVDRNFQLGVVPVYKYVDGDGVERVVKHGFDEKVSVVQSK